jgi:ABC-type glycerol-3-phosphate transport system substrate-binding protein
MGIFINMININKKQNQMKKMIIAMAAVIAFASCNSNGSTGTTTATDSTNVTVDSTKVDSTATVVDTTATTPDVKVK